MDTNPTRRLNHTSPNDNNIVGDDEDETLIPQLPDELATVCLSNFDIPPSVLFSVSRAWRRFLYSPAYPAFFSLYALLAPTDDQNSTTAALFFTYDPISATWDSLPPPLPSNPLIHRHPSFLSRNLPIQSVTVSDHLIIVAATTHHFAPALERPLVFDPRLNQWFHGPPLSVPRRWCAAGSARGSVYVASGIGAHYRADVARSVEEWKFGSRGEEDRRMWRWEKKAELKDGRFSREAVEAIGYKGKLCMVNVKGNAVKQGGVYHLDSDRWEDMPRGMISGWNGPATSRMDADDELYVVDEVSGELRRYNDDGDNWEPVVESSEFRGAEQIAAGRGRVCVVCSGGGRIGVVDVTSRPAGVWQVAPPRGLVAIAVHILPRVCR